MAHIKTFVFSPFDVNTYIMYDDSKECVIIDPACFSQQEQHALSDFIKKNKLKPVKILNTHCHLDHVFGNKFISDNFGIKSESSKKDDFLLQNVTEIARQYGLNIDKPYPHGSYLEEPDIIKFGNSELKVISVPGHTPGHLAFYSEKENFIFVGDVLFAGSIGRTDLPGGDFEILENSILSKLYTLPQNTKVYTGHGPATTIEREKNTNPFVKEK